MKHPALQGIALGLMISGGVALYFLTMPDDPFYGAMELFFTGAFLMGIAKWSERKK